ncbi:MAG: S8 family serine peptidase, partial [Acidobacteria bacterium]|nr:S8 family serine peptidase [Acidobacteriota bacterium]
NMILVRNGDADMVVNLAQRTDVARLERNPAVQHTFPRYESPAQKRAIEWNLIKIAAPDVWNAGFTGQDVVVGGQDTGYDWDHPAIKNQYLGWNGASVDHNYHWHDAIHSSAGPCPGNSLEPCDDHGHGTHTMGTAVGSDGGANQIGVAPGARWIGCRNMDQGNGTPATYSECFQWFIAPTDMNDLNPDPNRAPDVLINSWGCPTSEGCSFNSLKTVVDNVRAAGIVVVVSAGNSGSSCSTINDPPAIYASSFTVASTTNTDGISSFSSRGPVTVDGSNRLKPDIAAPGSSIRSSVAGGSYTTFSGTSMAGPHVSGLVALLLSAEPNLKGNVDAIEERIRMAALPLTSNQVCSGFSGMDHPNIVFGYGRIQAPETVFGDPCAGISSFADWMQGLGGNDTNGNGRVDIQEFLLLDSCLQN